MITTTIMTNDTGATWLVLFDEDDQIIGVSSPVYTENPFKFSHVEFFTDQKSIEFAKTKLTRVYQY